MAQANRRRTLGNVDLNASLDRSGIGIGLSTSKALFPPSTTKKQMGKPRASMGMSIRPRYAVAWLCLACHISMLLPQALHRACDDGHPHSSQRLPV